MPGRGQSQREGLLERELEQERKERERRAKAKAKARMPSRYYQQTTGPRQGAVIPAQDWVAPIPRHSGISQEPNSPWGVAIHDPLERQWFDMSPAGFPVLRNPNRYSRSTPQIGSVGGGGWGSEYYPRSYGGGGGGGWGNYPASVQPPFWWDPGLYNWRYGVTL